jgi:dTDP-glucose 4,6-dehydratase
VSGGAGFIGSHLCEALASRGYEVLAVDTLVTGNARNLEALERRDAIRLLVHDVSEELSVDGADLVVHAASLAAPAAYLARPLDTLRSGTIGTFNMLELARRSSARFLFTSTSEVYGDPLVHPQSEEYWGNVNPTGPRSCYDESKRCGEAIVMAHRATHGTTTRIVRIFNTYGPRMRIDDSRAVPRFIRQALRGEPLLVHGDGTQTRSFCYVTDLVDGLLAVLERGDHQPYNLGDPHETTVLDLARRIVRLVGSRSEIRFGDRPVDDPSRRCPVIDRAARLGWTPRIDLEEGLGRTIQHIRNAMSGASS